MPVKAAEDFLHKSQSVEDAYKRMDERYPMLGDSVQKLLTMEEQVVNKAAEDYVTAGIGYLANRGHNAYIRDLGTIAWRLINKKIVRTIMTNDMLGALLLLGVPYNVLIEQGVQNDEPYVLASSTGGGIILFPYEFLIKARTKPIEALATTVWICSYVRDIANKKIISDTANVEPRQSASQAEFLLEAKRRYPSLQLGQVYEARLKAYPEGIASLHAYQRY